MLHASCREVFRFLPGWPFQNLLLSPALEDNSDGGVNLATRDSYLGTRTSEIRGSDYSPVIQIQLYSYVHIIMVIVLRAETEYYRGARVVGAHRTK